jgi:hypothetical protein
MFGWSSFSSANPTRHRPLYAGDPISFLQKKNGLPGRAGQ